MNYNFTTKAVLQGVQENNSVFHHMPSDPERHQHDTTFGEDPPHDMDMDILINVTKGRGSAGADFLAGTPLRVGTADIAVVDGARNDAGTPSPVINNNNITSRASESRERSQSRSGSATPSLTDKDLQKIRKALDLDDPKRTDYTYSASQTYHMRKPPAAVWENPRMSRMSLHGKEHFITSPHDISWEEKGKLSMSGAISWLAGLFSRPEPDLYHGYGIASGAPSNGQQSTINTVNTTSTMTQANEAGTSHNGGFERLGTPTRTTGGSRRRKTAAELLTESVDNDFTAIPNGGPAMVTRSKAREHAFGFDDDDRANTGSGIKSGRQLQLLNWLITTVTTVCATTVTTLVSAVTYPAKRLGVLTASLTNSSDSVAHHTRRTTSRRQQRTAEEDRQRSKMALLCCWLPLLLLLLLLIPAAVLLGKDERYRKDTQKLYNGYVKPLPAALWAGSQGTWNRARVMVHNGYGALPSGNQVYSMLPAVAWPLAWHWNFWPAKVYPRVEENERQTISADFAGYKEDVGRLGALVSELRAELAALSKRCCKTIDLTAYMTTEQAHTLLADYSTKLNALGADLGQMNERSATKTGHLSNDVQQLNAALKGFKAELAALVARLVGQEDKSSSFDGTFASLEQKIELVKMQQGTSEKVDEGTVLSPELMAQIGQITAFDAKFKALDTQINYLRSRDEKWADYDEDMKNVRAEINDKLLAMNAKWSADLKLAISSLDLQKDDLVKLKTELLVIQTSQASSQGSTADLTSVKALIAAAIAKYDADKTGLADYALETSGGSVISIRCSETFSPKTRKESIFGIPLWYSNYGPRTVIQPGVNPGECWAFKGSVGYLVVQLGGTIDVSALSYEHIPRSVSPDGHLESAPREFEVWAIENEHDQNPFLLGKYSYDISANTEPLQMFPTQHRPNKPTSMIELKILNNHGHPNYTCLYRVRVHGKRISPAYGAN